MNSVLLPAACAQGLVLYYNLFKNNIEINASKVAKDSGSLAFVNASYTLNGAAGLKDDGETLHCPNLSVTDTKLPIAKKRKFSVMQRESSTLVDFNDEVLVNEQGLECKNILVGNVAFGTKLQSASSGNLTLDEDGNINTDAENVKEVTKTTTIVPSKPFIAVFKEQPGVIDFLHNLDIQFKDAENNKTLIYFEGKGMYRALKNDYPLYTKDKFTKYSKDNWFLTGQAFPPIKCTLPVVTNSFLQIRRPGPDPSVELGSVPDKVIRLSGSSVPGGALQSLAQTNGCESLVKWDFSGDGHEGKCLVYKKLQSGEGVVTFGETPAPNLTYSAQALTTDVLVSMVPASSGNKIKSVGRSSLLGSVVGKSEADHLAILKSYRKIAYVPYYFLDKTKYVANDIVTIGDDSSTLSNVTLLPNLPQDDKKYWVKRVGNKIVGMMDKFPIDTFSAVPAKIGEHTASCVVPTVKEGKFVYDVKLEFDCLDKLKVNVGLPSIRLGDVDFKIPFHPAFNNTVLAVEVANDGVSSLVLTQDPFVSFIQNDSNTNIGYLTYDPSEGLEVREERSVITPIFDGRIKSPIFPGDKPFDVDLKPNEDVDVDPYTVLPKEMFTFNEYAGIFIAIYCTITSENDDELIIRVSPDIRNNRTAYLCSYVFCVSKGTKTHSIFWLIRDFDSNLPTLKLCWLTKENENVNEKEKEDESSDEDEATASSDEDEATATKKININYDIEVVVHMEEKEEVSPVAST